MTRKHFEAIAKCIDIKRAGIIGSNDLPRVRLRQLAMLRTLVIDFCREFTSFNPSFDAVHFTEACGF